MRFLKYLSMILLMQGFVALIPSNVTAQHAAVSFQLFYDELAPYGTWISHPSYGFVWLPMDDPDSFFPYGSGGYWVLTEYGWTWVSLYKWGWAPFHYGRWDYDPAYGWFWIPDVVWGPAWVIWRHAPGYYGWAPMRPGITVVIVIGGGYTPPIPWWIFCEHRHFGRKHINEYYTPRKHYGRILGDSRIIERTYDDKVRGSVYVAGPSKEDIRIATGREVDLVTLSDRAKPGQDIGNGTISIFRPPIERTTSAEPSPTPRRLEDIKSTHSTPAVPVFPAAKETPTISNPPERVKSTPSTPPSEKAPRTTTPPKTVKSTPVKPSAPQTPPKEVRVPAQTPSKPRASEAPPAQGAPAAPAPKTEDERSKKR